MIINHHLHNNNHEVDNSFNQNYHNHQHHYHNHQHHYNNHQHHYHITRGCNTNNMYNNYLIVMGIFIAALYSGDIKHCDENIISTNSSIDLDILDITQSNMNIYDELKLRLLEFMLPSQIEMNLEELKQRGKPWNSYHRCDRYPQMIVCPSTTEQVSQIVKICNELRVPLVAFGGGTSIEGQTLAVDGGVSLDFSNMKRIITLNEEDLDVRVEAGLGYLELNEVLKPKGLWFPLDPGPGASVGGMCACRCSGSTAVRYGSMRENVLNLTAVLSDGSIIKTGSRARKSSAGYDITRLLIGSEGTLAIITEATLKLHGIPKVSYALRVAFPGGIKDAANCAKSTLNCGVTIGRCELLDETMVKIINQANPHSAAGPWLEETCLLYEVTGVTAGAVLEQLEIIKDIARSNGGTEFHVATTEAETKLLWQCRKECLWSAMSCYPDRDPMITDVCVPLTQLPVLIDSTKRKIDEMTIPCPIIAHAGDGNFHVLIFFDPSNLDEVNQANQLSSYMALEAIKLDGTCTGEHGIGTGKKQYLKLEMGEGTMKLMGTIKTAMDPHSILNPGKILDVEDKNSASSNSCNE